jgi:hypothetical protein
MSRRNSMSVKGTHYSVNTHQREEHGKIETTTGLILFRQTPWGKRNGETLVEFYPWNACMDRLGRPDGHAALDEDDLVNMIAGASAMLRNIRSEREQRKINRRVEERFERGLEERAGKEGF